LRGSAVDPAATSDAARAGHDEPGSLASVWRRRPYQGGTRAVEAPGRAAGRLQAAERRRSEGQAMTAKPRDISALLQKRRQRLQSWVMQDSHPLVVHQVREAHA